jgi:hypothetical protein
MTLDERARSATYANLLAEVPEFKEFGKIPRFNREVVITEKIDGTNAQVFVQDDGLVRAGSRKRWLTPGSDNFGFCAWVNEHADELRKLGPGRHYGEWWGPGIQREYGMAERRFSLFNVAKWGDDAIRPACCHVVPVLWRGYIGMAGMALGHALDILRHEGSQASPGFMRPEGIVIYHTASGHLYKVTLENDDKPKGADG